MTPEEIAAILMERFGPAIAEAVVDTAHPHVVVGADRWPEVARFLRDDARLRFDWLRAISGVDYPQQNELVAVYDLHATQAPAEPAGLWTQRHAFTVKIKVPRDHPHVPSVADVWPAAEWHERETYDLLGLVFDGNPDSVTDHDGTHPRRILCPDDWQGHPLRKDYEFPVEYHGIPGMADAAPGQAAPQPGATT
jgi:NADH-quinone oxidoreductase subunit C